MKAVKKFTTFEELKSTERDTKNPVERLKKHEAFEKVIKEIRADKVEKRDHTK
ncbi:MAG: hypothetical protein ACTHM7_12875 [Ginsengibacter sp.]